MKRRPVQRIGPLALTRTLAWLRLCAIAGQSVTVLICAWWMHMPIPLLPLLVGIGLLAVFAVFAAWRLSQPQPLRERETIVHIAADMLALGYLLYFTGGTSNPFITLLLVPIALSAAALTARALLTVSAIAAIVYIALLNWHVSLPIAMHDEFRGDMSLSVAGTGVNLLISALLLGFFINRLSHALRLQQLEVQRVRERALRDEGILAIATQAAGAAHELKLEDQVNRCRTILREMVAFGKAQLSQEPERLTVTEFIHGCLERFPHEFICLEACSDSSKKVGEYL
ncbi:MAG: hypothetical protein WDW38_003438 [Sanguina aurantia]